MCDDGNHIGAKQMSIAAIIPTRYSDVPIYRTSGIHRKEMKRNFPVELYHQRNKSETLFCNQKNDVRRNYIKESYHSGQ